MSSLVKVLKKRGLKNKHEKLLQQQCGRERTGEYIRGRAQVEGVNNHGGGGVAECRWREWTINTHWSNGGRRWTLMCCCTHGNTWVTFKTSYQSSNDVLIGFRSSVSLWGDIRGHVSAAHAACLTTEGCENKMAAKRVASVVVVLGSRSRGRGSHWRIWRVGSRRRCLVCGRLRGRRRRQGGKIKDHRRPIAELLRMNATGRTNNTRSRWRRAGRETWIPSAAERVKLLLRVFQF